MKTWVRKSMNVGVLSAGIILVAGSAAHADANTANNAGAAGGNQLDSTLAAPANAAGNAGAALLSWSEAESASAESAVANSAGGDMNSGWNAGILNGNQLSTTVQAPINVSCNSVAVLGFAQSCDDDGNGGGNSNGGGNGWHGNGNGGANGGYSAGANGGYSAGANGGYSAGANGGYSAGANGGSREAGGALANNAGSDMNTAYNAGILNGNQASTVVQVPINACGNAISVLGFADADCNGGSAVANNGGSTEGAMNTGFNSGIGNGNQVTTVLQAPINVCGNSIALLGFASADCNGGSAVANNGGGNGGANGGSNNWHHHHGNGNGGANGGYSAGANGGYSAGANGGYSAGANGGSHSRKAANERSMARRNGGGSANGSSAWAGGGNAVANNAGGDMNSGWNAGILNGNQVQTTVQAPLNITNNAVGLLGFASAG